MSLRFEKLLAERKGLEMYREMSGGEILGEIIKRYNSFRANSAIKRWQLSEEMERAAYGIITGLDAESRALL